MTTAIAPVAPEIIPDRPPINAVIKPIMKAAYSPTIGSTWATNAKATASGIRLTPRLILTKYRFYYYLFMANEIEYLTSGFVCKLIKRGIISTKNT